MMQSMEESGMLFICSLQSPHKSVDVKLLISIMISILFVEWVEYKVKLFFHLLYTLDRVNKVVLHKLNVVIDQL